MLYSVAVDESHCWVFFLNVRDFTFVLFRYIIDLPSSVLCFGFKVHFASCVFAIFGLLFEQWPIKSENIFLHLVVAIIIFVKELMVVLLKRQHGLGCVSNLFNEQYITLEK